MEALPYTSKAGFGQFRPACTPSDLQDILGSGEPLGWCLSCGETDSGISPDARKWTCEYCGADKVYGMEELALMGLVALVDEQIYENS